MQHDRQHSINLSLILKALWVDDKYHHKTSNINKSSVAAVTLLYLSPSQRIELPHIVGDRTLYMGSIAVCYESIQWYGQ